MSQKSWRVIGGIGVVALLVFGAYRLGERGHEPTAPLSPVTLADADARGLWTHLPLPTTVALRGISSGSDDAYAVGDRGTIVRRANGQATWTPQSSPTDRTLNAVAQRGAEVFAVGDGVIVERMADATWKLTREVPGLRGAAYSWMGPIAVGERGAIGVKGPSGWHWENSGTQANLRGVCAGLTEIFAVGEGGVILRYTVGSWTLQPRATTEDLEAIACDDLHAIAVGTGGVVVERKDGVWTRSNAGADPLHGVAATFGMKSWVAVGDKGSVQRSLGGEPASTVGDLFGVTEGPQGELAVGEGGLFLRVH